MHVKNYIAPRDDARAKIILPIMQRNQLKILNDPKRPTFTRSNAKTIIDYLFSTIPSSTWLIPINRTSHMMITAEIKRKTKATTRVISCIPIPFEGFQDCIHKYISEGKSPHMCLVETLRFILGTSRRFKPLPTTHPYDSSITNVHPMQFFRTFKAFKRVNGPLNKPIQDRCQRFL